MKSTTLSGTLLAVALTSIAGAQTVARPTPIQQQRRAQALAARTAQKPHPTIAPLSSPFAPPPLVGGSDACASPDVIVGTGLFAFDNTTASTGTQGQAEALCALEYADPTVNDDVWFTWVATFTGTAAITTCSHTSVDTEIAVYPGNTCPATTALACNDDACPSYQSSVQFACTSGNSYVIQLGCSSLSPGFTGTGQFSLVQFASPAHDNCATPQVLSGSGPFVFDDSFATTGTQGQGETLCNFYASTTILNDLWYTWTAPSTGAFAVVSLGLTDIDTKVAVYAGAGCPGAPALGCNDDGEVDQQSIAEFAATGGNAYTIQLGLDPYSFGGGAGQFAIIAQGPKANDSCAAPVAIAGTGAFWFDNTYSTTGTQGQLESLCNQNSTTSIASDSWYVWTPGASGTATISMCPGTFIDTKLAVYTGGGCPSAPAIACNDDTCGPMGYQSVVTFAVSCGQDYLLQLGTFDYGGFSAGGLGTIGITIASASPCPTTFTSFCFGDGTDAACPCGNFGALGRGCQNFAGSGGAVVTCTGVASLANDTLVLHGGSAAPLGPGLYFQGSGTIGGGPVFGTPYGHGVVCMGGSVVRLQIVNPADGLGASQTTLVLHNLGGITVPVTRNYQLWYRDGVTVGTCTAAALAFNFSDAITLSWVP